MNGSEGRTLPESIHDGTLPPPDMVVIPIPSLRVNRLANASKHAQAAQIMVLDVLFTQTAEEADGGRGGIELGQLVFLDGLPVARRCGIDGRGFEHGRRNTVCKRAVDDVSDKEIDEKEALECHQFGN